MMCPEQESAPYLPFDCGRFRLTMGLLPLPAEAWIEIDGHFAADLAAKRTLLESRPGEVFAALPEAEAPASELLALLGRHLPQHHAASFRRDGDRLANLVTAEAWDLAHPLLHPLDLAGRLVQEDLCLLLPQGEAYGLAGASLCSPNRWLLGEKIGQPLAVIHDPVPGYRATLQRPVDRFFARLTVEKPVWRLNWGITDDPEPFQPVPRAQALAPTPDTAGQRLWLRVERQTLRRLAETSAVVFTIRTHITRLDAAIATAATAAELAAALREMPPATQAYKHIAPTRPALLAWLDRRAGGQRVS
jgi:heme-dependent oxidative N-demethylase alpha subunit-like protein